MPRLFVAIRPPEDVRDALLDVMAGVEGVRWQDDDQLHLTLAFLGAVDERDGEALADALDSVRARPFELAVRGVGHFEHKGHPSALWAAIGPSEPLAQLQRRVVSACRRAGTAPDPRKFLAHVTLARLKPGNEWPGRWLAAHARLAAGPWQVDRFTLFLSDLRPTGSVYEPLADFRFAS
jgi:2'-5' RNA ligase